MTATEKKQLSCNDEDKRHEAVVRIALKYTFDPQKNIYFRSNIRSCGPGPMADIEWASIPLEVYKSQFKS